MYLHRAKNGHYTPPCCYFSGELEVVECLSQIFSGRSRFFRGIKGLNKLLEKKWKQKKEYYLGEWHLHPGRLPSPKEILLAMNYDIEQCSVQFQIVDCTEEEEKKIIDLDFALNGAEATVDFTKALNLYLLSIGYIDEGDLEEYRQKVSRLS